MFTRLAGLKKHCARVNVAPQPRRHATSPFRTKYRPGDEPFGLSEVSIAWRYQRIFEIEVEYSARVMRVARHNAVCGVNRARKASQVTLDETADNETETSRRGREGYPEQGNRGHAAGRFRYDAGVR